MTAAMNEQDPNLEEIIDLLKLFFKNDDEKVQAWLTTGNLNFGGSTPEHLINAGRSDRVLLFIRGAALFIRSAAHEEGWDE